MYIRGEDVRGYCIDEKDYCSDCMPNEPDNLTPDKLITDVDEEDFRFCDVCNKRI